MSPQRIQQRRTKGWRKPEGAVAVGRPTKWGNPFSAMECARRFPSLTSEQVAGFIVNQFRYDLYVLHPEYPGPGQILTELRGKDLMCWCPLDSPGHADVLLELANGDPR
jgi:hypothetical protein